MGTLLTAHSGCDGTPANSKEFLEYALHLPIDAVEVDIRPNKDGALILSHDDAPNGLPLTEAFALLRAYPGIKMNCDIKVMGTAGPVCRIGDEYGVLGQLLFSGDVGEGELREETEWYYNAELLFTDIYQTPAKYMKDESVVPAIREKLTAVGAACLNINYRIHETPLYRALIDADVPLSLWTPGDEELLARFMREGVYNITTRSAAAACRLRQLEDGH